MTSGVFSAMALVLDRWRQDAAVLRAHGFETTASLCERHAAEIESAWCEAGDEVLTLREASVESGLSADHLGRLVREGVIRNAGRKHSPRIRRVDLPRKAARLHREDAPVIVHGTSKRQLARSVVNSEHGRHDG